MWRIWDGDTFELRKTLKREAITLRHVWRGGASVLEEDGPLVTVAQLQSTSHLGPDKGGAVAEAAFPAGYVSPYRPVKTKSRSFIGVSRSSTLKPANRFGLGMCEDKARPGRVDIFRMGTNRNDQWRWDANLGQRDGTVRGHEPGDTGLHNCLVATMR